MYNFHMVYFKRKSRFLRQVVEELERDREEIKLRSFNSHNHRPIFPILYMHGSFSVTSNKVLA